MKLIFLSQANLKDKTFIYDLVNAFSSTEPTILLHDHFGAHIEDTRFVTKRLSALLSEANVVNSAFSGDQRTILKKLDGVGVVLPFEFCLEISGVRARFQVVTSAPPVGKVLVEVIQCGGGKLVLRHLFFHLHLLPKELAGHQQKDEI